MKLLFPETETEAHQKRPEQTQKLKKPEHNGVFQGRLNLDNAGLSEHATLCATEWYISQCRPLLKTGREGLSPVTVSSGGGGLSESVCCIAAL